MDFLVSPEDEWLLHAYRWNRNKRSGYAQASVRLDDGRRTVFLLHRLVAKAAVGEHVDHIDGNPANNRRENLRICTHAQNMKNRRINKNSSTGVKGVWADNRKFRTEIKADGERVKLGLFEHLADAALVYRLAAIHYHGEFARFS